MGLGTNNPVQQSGTGMHIHNAGGQTRINLLIILLVPQQMMDLI